jgi:hypothetical protein
MNLKEKQAWTTGENTANKVASRPNGDTFIQKNYLILIMTVFCLIVSCENKEIYKADITVINNSDFIIDDFTLECENEKNNIVKLIPDEQNMFDVKWVGRTSFFAASTDNSFVFLKIEYSINGKIHNVSNEVGASQDDYGYYHSNQAITNDSKVNIEINNNGYEIIVH